MSDRDMYIKQLEENLTRVVRGTGRTTVCMPVLDLAIIVNLLKESQVQKHGHWKDDKYGNMLCSVCGGLAIVSMTGCLVDRHLAPYLSDYCPNCGAKMDEEVKQ